MALSDSGGNTAFLWNAGAGSDNNNGGGAKTTAWDARGAKDDFVDGDGSPTSNTGAWADPSTANSVEEHTGDAVKIVVGNVSI